MKKIDREELAGKMKSTANKFSKYNSNYQAIAGMAEVNYIILNKMDEIIDAINKLKTKK